MSEPVRGGTSPNMQIGIPRNKSAQHLAVFRHVTVRWAPSCTRQSQVCARSKEQVKKQVKKQSICAQAAEWRAEESAPEMQDGKE